VIYESIIYKPKNEVTAEKQRQFKYGDNFNPEAQFYEKNPHLRKHIAAVELQSSQEH